MPQWRDHLIDYWALKKAIKKQVAQGTHGSKPEEVSTAFTAMLDQHVETVNNFYMERIEEGVIILHALQQHCEQIRAGSERPEMRTLCQRSLVAIHFQLLLLQHYVALNFTAVAKILKKFEKKFEIPIRNDYIGALVELPFYRCDALGELVEETERLFNSLTTQSGAPAEPPSKLAGGEQAVPHAGAMPPPPPPARTPTVESAFSAAAIANSMPPPPPRPPMCAQAMHSPCLPQVS